MTLYKATAEGDVLLSPEEEAEIRAIWDKHNSLSYKKAKLKEKISELRYKSESKGLLVNGVNVRTDDLAQSRISRALSYVGRRPISINFKDANGNFIALTPAQLTAIFDAVGDHIQSCYSAEKAHCDAVDALTDQDIDSYDITANWP